MYFELILQSSRDERRDTFVVDDVFVHDFYR